MGRYLAKIRMEAKVSKVMEDVEAAVSKAEVDMEIMAEVVVETITTAIKTKIPISKEIINNTMPIVINSQTITIKLISPEGNISHNNNNHIHKTTIIPMV